MAQTGMAIAWLALSPVAVLTNAVAAVVVCHYKGHFHGTDVALLSLLASMCLGAMVVVPVPALLALYGDDWRWSALCSAYVWATLCARMSELLVTLVMNVHWMFILRFTTAQEVYSSTTLVKIFVIVSWVAAAVTGIVPVVGHSFYTYYTETTTRRLVAGGEESGGVPRLVTTSQGECHFLPEGLGLSFMLFFVLATLSVLVLSLVASADTLAVFHYMRRTAVDKYKAARFYLPSSQLLNPAFSNRGAGVASTPGVNGGQLSAADRTGHDDKARAPTTDSHLNNGGVSAVYTNGTVPGQHAETSLTESDVAAGVVLSGDTAVVEGVPGNQQDPSDVCGNGDTRCGAGVNGGAGAGVSATVARSAAAVVVRPSVKSGVARSTPTTVHERYNELSLSAELCRVVFCFTMLSALLHHLPFVVLQFVQLAQSVDRGHAESAVLWMTLVHSLLLPHVLWATSRRYRHAMAYTWTVHVRRDHSAREEDAAACTLQSYTRKVVLPEGDTVNVTANVRGRGPITMTTYGNSSRPDGQVNGNAINVRADPETPDACTSSTAPGDTCSQDTGLPASAYRGHGPEMMTTDLDDGMTVVTNLASRQVTYIYSTPPNQSPDSPSPLRDNSDGCPAPGSRRSSGAVSQGRVWPEGARGSPLSSAVSPASSPATSSPSRSSLGTPSHGSSEAKRSSSARKAWKQQMLKKHLPAIFVNEAFEMDEEVVEEGGEEGQKSASAPQLPDVTRVTRVGNAAQSGRTDVNPRAARDKAFHYYMSGDFHHDYLRSDSLPRHIENESEGASFQYDHTDIEGILDREHSIRSQRSTMSAMSTFRGDSQSHPIALQGTHHRRPPFDTVAGAHGEEADAVLLETGVELASEANTHVHCGHAEEDSESGGSTGGLVSGTAGSGNPPAPAPKPSLQHQRSLCSEPDDGSADPGAGGVNVAPDSVQVEDEWANNGFYPTFKRAENASREAPSSELSDDVVADNSEDPDVGSDKSLASRIVLTAANTDEAGHSEVADTDEVFISIQNVTTDHTHTDAAAWSSTPCRSPSPLPSAAAVHSEAVGGFVPQSQACVLGILMEDGTEITAPQQASADSHTDTPASEPSVQQAQIDFESACDFSPTHTLFNPFSDSEHDAANTWTNPFLADIPSGPDVEDRHWRDNGPVDSGDVSSAADDVIVMSDAEDASITYHVLSSQTPQDVPGEQQPLARCDVTTPESEDSGSVSSEASVVLEPYTVDRRPPWMDDEDFDDDPTPVTPKKRSLNPFRPSFDAGDCRDPLESPGDFGSSFGSNSEILTIFENQDGKADFGNPFAYDSFSDKFIEDSDFRRASSDSSQLFGEEQTGSLHSYPLFDEETDRGFEDALAFENVISANPYFGHFQRFESIEEEPEEDATASNHADREGSDKDFQSAGAAPSLYSHGNSTTKFPETNPFEAMNGNSSIMSSSSSSGPSPVFSSTNPFSPLASPERTFGFTSGQGVKDIPQEDTTSALAQPSLFNGEPGEKSEGLNEQNRDLDLQYKHQQNAYTGVNDRDQQNEDLSVQDKDQRYGDTNLKDTDRQNGDVDVQSGEKGQQNGDTGHMNRNTSAKVPDLISESPKVPTAPRVRLTKPILWKRSDSKSDRNSFDSDSSVSGSGVMKGFPSRTNSDDGPENTWAGSAAADGKGQRDTRVLSDAVSRPKKPPVPIRPKKQSRVDVSGDTGSAVQQQPGSVFF